MRFVIPFVIALGLYMFRGLPATGVTANSANTEHPLIVVQNQGEVRFWRPLVSESPAQQKFDTLSRFIIKIDRKHGGSPDFWFGTETLPASAGIPYHRHLHEDEVVYVVSGSVHVHEASLTGDAGPGAIVFIPRDTWVSLQPMSKTPVSLFFAFNAPGFDNYMRCESALLGERAQPVTIEEDRRCTKAGDVQYR